MYRGSKPCIGCGENNTRPSADSLCYVCQKHLRIGQEVEESREKKNSRVATMGRFKHNMGTHSLKTDGKYGKTYVDRIKYIGERNGKGIDKELVNAYNKILDELNIGYRENPETYIYVEGSSYGSDWIYIEENLAILISDFLEKLAEYTKILSEESFERGKNLLVGLNEGTITLKDFEER